MHSAIEIIKDEHRSMGAVVKGLQARLAAVTAGTEQPDYPLFAAMFDYIEAVPDRIHHPKEDDYLFRLLRMRSEESHSVLDELEAQHASCAELLAGARKTLARYRETGELAPFQSSLDAYADFLFAHMRREEEVVLPFAEQALTEEDWRAIDTAFEANRSHAGW